MADVPSSVEIPDSRIAREAEFGRRHEGELLFNHSVRVYLFGAVKGLRQSLKFDSGLLYVAALVHDVGVKRRSPETGASERATARSRQDSAIYGNVRWPVRR